MQRDIQKINRRIFTDEQQYFLLKNLERDREVSRKLEELNKKKEKGLNDDSIRFSLNSQQELIHRTLEPFAKRYKLYKDRYNAIIEQHGYGQNDIYDSETIGEIIALQEQMREEVSGYSENLVDRKPLEKESNRFQKTKSIYRNQDFSR